MQSDELGQSLHDKLTRGAALSDQENSDLEQWYAQLDQRETGSFERPFPSPAMGDVETQMATAVLQLQSISQRIQALTADNAAVRQEIADLQRQLAQKSATQTA